MAIRRFVHRVLWPALLVLPAWVLLGRAFFGVPLGLQFLGQLVLVPRSSSWRPRWRRSWS